MKNDRLKSILGIPYFLFLVIFVVCPVLILLYYAFTNGAGEFSLANFTLFFTDSKAIGTLIYSVDGCCRDNDRLPFDRISSCVSSCKGRIPARECFINVICNAYVDQLHFAYHGIKRNLDIDRRKSCISSIPKYRNRYDL